MLGVRRTSVTEVARRMQDQGIITYARGIITILDRPGLEKLSCECYQTLREHGSLRDRPDLVVTFDDFGRIVDLDRHYGLEATYVEGD